MLSARPFCWMLFTARVAAVMMSSLAGISAAQEPVSRAREPVPAERKPEPSVAYPPYPTAMSMLPPHLLFGPPPLEPGPNLAGGGHHHSQPGTPPHYQFGHHHRHLPDALLAPPSPYPPGPGEYFLDDEHFAWLDHDDMPEWADLTNPAGCAFCSLDAIPAAIGDGGGVGGRFLLDDGLGNAIRGAPVGERKFKAANNNSPLPRRRVYCNYQFFSNALAVTSGGVRQAIDVDRYEFGVEYALCRDVASLELQVPLSRTLNTDLRTNGGLRRLKNNEFGNIAAALKVVLCQNNFLTFSTGVGVDLPTADDFTITDAAGWFAMKNQSVTVSPYVAALMADPCGNLFAQSFVQVAVPLNENTVSVFDGVDTVSGTMKEAMFLYMDASVGYWLSRDEHGGGTAGILELHYTADLNGMALLDAPSLGGASLRRVNADFLNATAGLTMVHGRWDLTSAVVLPLFSEPDRLFDWQSTVRVNRRF